MGHTMDTTEIINVSYINCFFFEVPIIKRQVLARKRPSEVSTATSTAVPLQEIDALLAEAQSHCYFDESSLEIDVTRVADAQSGHFVRIDKMEKKKSMGLEVGIVKNVNLGDWTSGGLKIHLVSQGLVQKWNHHNPGLEVCVNDIIVEVNSLKGNGEELLKEIEKEQVLHLRLLRPSDF